MCFLYFFRYCVLLITGEDEAFLPGNKAFVDFATVNKKDILRFTYVYQRQQQPLCQALLPNQAAAFPQVGSSTKIHKHQVQDELFYFFSLHFPNPHWRRTKCWSRIGFVVSDYRHATRNVPHRLGLKVFSDNTWQVVILERRSQAGRVLFRSMSSGWNGSQEDKYRLHEQLELLQKDPTYLSSDTTLPELNNEMAPVSRRQPSAVWRQKAVSFFLFFLPCSPV